MTDEKVISNDDSGVDPPKDTDRVSDEAGSPLDHEIRELSDLMDAVEKVKAMPNPEEHFYPVGRAARRAQDKRNRALQKRNPRG